MTTMLTSHNAGNALAARFERGQLVERPEAAA